MDIYVKRPKLSKYDLALMLSLNLHHCNSFIFIQSAFKYQPVAFYEQKLAKCETREIVKSVFLLLHLFCALKSRRHKKFCPAQRWQLQLLISF